MERARVLRFLRIAVTVLSLTACVLLIALWVRSYWNMEVLSIPLTTQRAIQFGSAYGKVVFALDDTSGYPKPEIISVQINDLRQFMDIVPPSPWGSVTQGGGAFVLWVPSWLMVLVSAVLAAAPWIRWSKRFSLRTLLIATTLVATGLGMVVYLSG